MMGKPEGLPIVVLHGGPGSGTASTYEEILDLERFFVIYHDQRGSGRSRPRASDPDTDMSVNTTHHLIGDIELLRRHLGIERWIVFGASWGSALALSYAQRNLDAVLGIVLSPVTVTTRRDIDWLYRGAGALYPEAWSAFSGTNDLTVDVAKIIDSYAVRLEDPDPAVRAKAAAAWCRWEDTVTSGNDAAERNPRYEDTRFTIGFARTVTHFFRHGAWLEDDELIRNAPNLGAIPGTLVHGLDDVSAPIDSARRLASAWPGAHLVEVEGAAHSFSNSRMRPAIADGVRLMADDAEG